MKNHLLRLMLALIVMGGFTACNNDDDLFVQEPTATESVIISATIDGVTRLALGDSEAGKTKMEWTAGDAFMLTIGSESYTFEWKSGNDFEYDGENGDFPATFAETGTITATYPATGAAALAEQSGLKSDVGNYMQLDAVLDVTAGQPTSGLNISFVHVTSVVEIAVEHSELAGKEVVVDLRTTSDVLYSTPAEGGALSFDGEGKLTLYFAVVPTAAEISDWNVGVWDVAGSKYLTASLSAMQLTSGKLYKVSKAKHDFSTSYEISSGSNLKVTAYDAIGLYEWRARASADPTTNVVDLELGADITLPTAGITLTDGLPDKGNWTPVPGGNSLQYKGTIDGKDHTITNMYIVPEEKMYPYGGFVSMVSKSTITNLDFDGAKIVVGDEDDPLNSGGSYIGVIVGEGTANISDCHVTNSIVKSIGNDGGFNCQIGGLIGSLSSSSGYGAVTDCSFSGTVEGFNIVGGIVGEQQKDTKIANCSASGTVDGSMKVGGIAGEAKGFIAMCTNEANIKGSMSGGIVGNLTDHTGTYDSCIIGCTNKGRIDGTASSGYDGTGGIVGRVYKDYSTHSFIIGCRNLSSEVYKTGGGVNYVAGVVGKFENATATPTGVYGSYTVTMTDADAQYNSRAVGSTMSSTAVSACPDGFASNADLATDVATMNTQVTNGVTAATTSPRKIYENTYNNYTWTWTSGSWPEFSAPALP